MEPKRPVLRYHGGKWKLAPWIISHFPTHRIYIVSGQSGDDGNRLTIRYTSDPSFVVSSSEIKRPVRASAAGRTVKLNPRCLARLQSIPDDYALPDDDALAVRIVGNAVPPLLYRRLVEELVTSWTQ